MAERPLGGIWFAALLVNDQRGLQDMSLVDTTRKRFLNANSTQSRAARDVGHLPGDYALRLVREAVDLTRELGGGLPTRYQRVARRLRRGAWRHPSARLVYETISPVEINFNPGWLEDSPRLLGEPELAGWYVAMPADLRTRALEVARGAVPRACSCRATRPSSRRCSSSREAAQQALTPLVRRGLAAAARRNRLHLRRRPTDCRRRAWRSPRPARWTRSGPPAERHPLLRLLLAAGLARLLGAETIGGRRAAEVLLELVERASSSRRSRRQPGNAPERPDPAALGTEVRRQNSDTA